MEGINYVATPKLGFAEAVKKVLTNVTNFNGRSRRSEYWWYVLATVIFNMVVGLLLGRLSLQTSILSIIISLSMLAVTVRRMKDSGKSPIWAYLNVAFSIITVIYMYVSGFYDFANTANPNPADIVAICANPFFLAMVTLSVVVGLVVFIFSLFDSNIGPNKYGDSPKYVAE